MTPLIWLCFDFWQTLSHSWASVSVYVKRGIWTVFSLGLLLALMAYESPGSQLWVQSCAGEMRPERHRETPREPNSIIWWEHKSQYNTRTHTDIILPNYTHKHTPSKNTQNHLHVQSSHPPPQYTCGHLIMLSNTSSYTQGPTATGSQNLTPRDPHLPWAGEATAEWPVP